MQELNLISGIIVVVLYSALIALVIYLIIAIKRIVSAVDNINSTIDNMEKKVDHIATKAEPLIDNSLIISNDLKEISSSLRIQTAKVEGIVDSVRDTTDSIIEFEQKVQKEVETNVFDTLNMIAALSKGVRTFFSAIKGTGSGNGSHSKNRIRSVSAKVSEEDLY
ncbi:MAG: DUF948 domain-containing protein [Ignavibacteria bacterium]